MQKIHQTVNPGWSSDPDMGVIIACIIAQANGLSWNEGGQRLRVQYLHLVVGCTLSSLRDPWSHKVGRKVSSSIYRGAHRSWILEMLLSTFGVRTDHQWSKVKWTSPQLPFWCLAEIHQQTYYDVYNIQLVPRVVCSTLWQIKLCRHTGNVCFSFNTRMYTHTNVHTDIWPIQLIWHGRPKWRMVVW